MRRALALAALLVLTPPAVAAQDAQKRLADLLVELLDGRTQPTTAGPMEKLEEEMGAVVGGLTARDPADFYNRKLDDLAIAALRAHRPERAADWEVDARRRYISQTRAVLRALRQALEMRNLDEGALPTTEHGPASLALNGGPAGPHLAPPLPL